MLYRTSESILLQDVAEERIGIVPNVVFPTGTDLHRDGTVGAAKSDVGSRDSARQPRKDDGYEAGELHRHALTDRRGRHLTA